MDQVLMILNEALPAEEAPPRTKKGKADKRLTASMINNYVKQGLIEPPQKKRYATRQVAALLLIGLLKNLLPIADIKLLLNAADEQGLPDFYDNFVQYLDGFLSAPHSQAANEPDLAESAARALAQKFYLQSLLHD